MLEAPSEDDLNLLDPLEYNIGKKIILQKVQMYHIKYVGTFLVISYINLE